MKTTAQINLEASASPSAVAVEAPAVSPLQERQRTWGALNDYLDTYVDDYELCTDGGYYTPNEQERLLLIDITNGLMADDEFLTLVYAALSARATPAALAAAPAGAQPVDMVLWCPRCGLQHVDAPEPETGWTNPTHTSHLCHGCGLIWRPASIPTNGVDCIPAGSRDNWRTDSLRFAKLASPVAQGWQPIMREALLEFKVHIDAGTVQCESCKALLNEALALLPEPPRER